MPSSSDVVTENTTRFGRRVVAIVSILALLSVSNFGSLRRVQGLLSYYDSNLLDLPSISPQTRHDDVSFSRNNTLPSPKKFFIIAPPEMTTSVTHNHTARTSLYAATMEAQGHVFGGSVNW